MSGAARRPRHDQVVARFEANLVEFVRSFGLLQPDRTPCGQPLHASQAHTLSIVAASPGISQHDLTIELGLARATVSELVTGLCERGWLTRARASDDRRIQRLTLTADGRRVASQVASSRQALMSDVLDSLDPDERDLVVDALARLAVGARRTIAINGSAAAGGDPREPAGRRGAR
jgi:DNA-binding MarR family transcriptional regulator